MSEDRTVPDVLMQLSGYSGRVAESPTAGGIEEAGTRTILPLYSGKKGFSPTLPNLHLAASVDPTLVIDNPESNRGFREPDSLIIDTLISAEDSAIVQKPGAQTHNVPRKEISYLNQEVQSGSPGIGEQEAIAVGLGLKSPRPQVSSAEVSFANLSDFKGLLDRCDLLIALGEAQSRKGERESAEYSLREAALLAERFQDSARLTQIVLALPAWHWPGPGEANPLALLLAQRALILENKDVGRRAISMARLAAEISYSPGHQIYSRDLSATAMEQVLTETNPLCELYVRLYRDQILRQPENLSDRLANAEEILRLGIEIGDYGACYVAAMAESMSLSMMGDMYGAEHAAEFAIGIVPMSQVRFHPGLSAAYHAHNAVMDGRFADAWREFDRCRASAIEYNLPYLADTCWPTMLIPSSEEDRLCELEVIAEETVRRRPTVLVYSALLSWIKVRRGLISEASYILERLAADQFLNLSKSSDGLVGMALLADVCGALHRQDYAVILHDWLLGHASLNVTLNAAAVFGNTERYLGILAVALDRLDEAIGHFEKALCSDKRCGARPWAIYSSIELARSLARRGSVEDRTKAIGLLLPLEAEASRLNMRRARLEVTEIRELLSLDELAEPQNPGAACESIEFRNAKGEADFKHNEVFVRRAEKAHTGGSPESLLANGKRVATFCRNGEYWKVGYQGRTSSLRHRRGLELIWFLLRHPTQECFALEIMNKGDALSVTQSPENGRAVDYPYTPLLDVRAKRSYRDRLKEISKEIEHFREANDFERAAKLEQEQDFLTRELAGAIGLFGRDRKFNSESERARKRVSIAIARAIRMISLHDEDFAFHLERSIKTGNLCCYVPDRENPIEWIL